MEESIVEQTSKKPKLLKYVSVFLLANLIWTVFAIGASTAVYSVYSLNVYVYDLVHTLAMIGACSISFIGIYAIFRDLNMKKVMPYVLVWIFLKIFIGVMAALEEYWGSQTNLLILLLSNSSVAFISGGIFYLYFRHKPDRWY